MFGNLFPFKPLLVSTLESALNRYLSLDQNLEQYLEPLAGKVIAIHITPFNETLFLCPSRQRIQILESYPDKVDARLSGSLVALGLMSLSAKPMRSLHNGIVRIEGDTLLAQKLQRVFEKLDINPEANLARYTGNAFAQRATGLMRNSRDWSQQTYTSFRLNLEEFLQEETRDLPAKAEAEQVFQAIDDSCCDLDRLNARVERLSKQLNSGSEHH